LALAADSDSIGFPKLDMGSNPIREKGNSLNNPRMD
jgi:hypothetical protein